MYIAIYIYLYAYLYAYLYTHLHTHRHIYIYIDDTLAEIRRAAAMEIPRLRQIFQMEVHWPVAEATRSTGRNGLAWPKFLGI